MPGSPQKPRILNLQLSQLWSGDLGLTLISISLVILVFVILPLSQAGLRGRFFFDLLMVTLMISGALTQKHSRLLTVFVIAVLFAGAVALWTSRVYPTAHLQELSSFLSLIALLVYVRIVLLVMFREGPVTWSRIQGGVAAYLLLGLAWGSAFRLVEELHAGSFRFVSPPANVDQLTSKLVYFSFVTLTTIGYGDIAPVSPAARSLAIAEAVVGQLFPAIFIGALVAMAMQSRKSP